MPALKRFSALSRCFVPALIVTVLLAGCAAQRLRNESKRQFNRGQVQEGLASLREAMRLDPNNVEDRLEYSRRVSEEINRQTRRGDQLREQGDFSRAKAIYGEAIKISPGNERLRQTLDRIEVDERHAIQLADASRLLESGKAEPARDIVRGVLRETPSDANARKLQARIDAELEARRHAREAILDAQSVLKRPVTLQFRDANLRMVFEALSRTTGLNVVFDREVRPDLKTTIFVRDGSVADTVDLILLQNQLEKKVLNANTIFIYPATPAKQKEYQDMQVRTFRISNGDAKAIMGMLKNVLKVKEAEVDERTNTLVVRDTPEALDVAAKVIAAHDLPDAEVMLEIEVLEISRDRLTDLGVKWPDGVTVATPADAGGNLTVGALKKLSHNDLLVSPLQLRLNLKLQDTDANLLASPRIRMRDREKAKILIGDKVPVITNSVTPMATGTSVVTGSIQYIDVGIKVEAESHVYEEGDIGIKLNLEVSNIVKEVAGSGGSLAYQIGTRNASTSLRLRDGETEVLGGLINDTDRSTAAKVPGVGQLPLLGRLFSDHTGDHAKSEIVLSITPRIVRAQGVADESMTNTWSGTESVVREKPLRLDPISSVTSGIGNAAAAPAPAQPAVQGRAADTDMAPHVEAKLGNMSAGPQAPATPAIAPHVQGATHAGEASQDAGFGGAPQLSWKGPGVVRQGDSFSVSVQAEGFDGVSRVPIAIQFDPVILSFVGADLGDFGARSGAVKGEPVVNQGAGRLNLTLDSGKGKTLTGGGELLRLTFSAKLPRPMTQMALGRVSLRQGDKAQGIPLSQPLTLKIEP